MTEKQMRELDVWVAEHVMGWKRVPVGQIEHDGMFAIQGIEIYIHDRGSYVETFDPTTDPAAAMQVLEKCAEREFKANFDGVQIDKIESGYLVSTCNMDADAKTLPLAICLFAKKLFEKKGQT